MCQRPDQSEANSAQSKLAQYRENRIIFISIHFVGTFWLLFFHALHFFTPKMTFVMTSFVDCLQTHLHSNRAFVSIS